MDPMVEEPDDPDAMAQAMLQAFKMLHGCTMLEAFMAMKAGIITDEQLTQALTSSRLMVETRGNA